jgi:propanol-preferring alcohol dehydrogenase
MGLRIVAIDTGKDKEELCKRLGAEVFIDFKEVADVPAKVIEVTDGGAHAVVVTGGTKSAYDPVPFMLRTGGTMVCVGLPAAGTTVAGCDPMMVCRLLWTTALDFTNPIVPQMCAKRITIRGSMVGSMSETDEALEFAARGLVSPIYQVFPFKDFAKAVDLLVGCLLLCWMLGRD